MILTLTLSEGTGGFDPLDPASIGTLFWTWVIFLGALPFIWKMVMGPITGALEERDANASRAIAAAEKAGADAEKARADVEVALGEAQAEAAKLLQNARERAEVREHEIVQAAKQEASQMVENARKTIQAEQDKALSALRSQVVDLTFSAANRVLERNVDSEDDRRMVTQLIGGQGAPQN